MSDTDKPLISPEGADLIRRYLLGGVGIGGAAALTTSLINYLHHLKKQNQEESDKDDDTIYVYKNSSFTKKAILEEGLALTAGTAGVIGTYALVKKLYSMLREKQAQEELDRQQHIFLEDQGYRDIKDAQPAAAVLAEKSASERKPLSTVDTGLGMVAAVPLLLALASGVVTHKVLSNMYPTKDPGKVHAPKRIEVVEKPSNDQEEYAKSAGSDMDDDAREFLVRMTMLNPVKDSDLQNVIKTAALGGFEGMKDTAMNVNFLTAVEMTKGASANYTSPFADHLAVCLLTKSAYMSTPVSVLAAGEFAEQYPITCQQAASLPQDTQDTLYKIAACMGNALRAELSQQFGISANRIDQTKQAAAGETDEEEMLSLLLNRLKERADQAGVAEGEEGEPEDTTLGAAPATKGDDTESSETSGEEAGITDSDSPSRISEQNKMKLLNASKTMRRNSGDLPMDEIDHILSPQE